MNLQNLIKNSNNLSLIVLPLRLILRMEREERDSDDRPEERDSDDVVDHENEFTGQDTSSLSLII
uniref:Uncharacterized protein n=1 Tax=Meloidogyne enterolobii TaxID=390850 RepID=A0A6V7WBX6_MELEN|nr:unnamed protein product [Meloidogyne enterolobii]